MIDPQYALLMARYNRWMNARLHLHAAVLSDAERKTDRGAFFKSLHGTFEHLMFADNIWMNRFTGRSLDGRSPAMLQFEDFDGMRARRIELDEEILQWAGTLSRDWLASDLRYYSQAYEHHYTRPAWLLVSHFFNHQTHHRGQLTTLLMQRGIDPGATDLSAMPDPEP